MLAHQLTPYEFGLFFACFSFIGLVTGLKELGTSSAAVKYIAHYCAKRRWALMRETMIWFFLWQLLCFGVAAVGVLVFLKPLATFYFKDPNATSVMLWLLLLGLFAVVHHFFVTTFQGFKAVKESALTLFFLSCLVLSFSYLFIWFGWGADAPAAGYAVATGVVLVLCGVMLYRLHPDFFKKMPNLRLSTLSRLLHFGFKVTAGIIGGMIFSYIDVVTLTYWRPLVDVGLLGVATTISSLIRYIPRGLAYVVFPLSAELHALHDDRLAGGVKRIHRYLLVILVPIAVATIAFAHVILNMFFPTSYAEASSVLRMLAIAQILGATALMNSYVLLGIGKPKAYALMHGVGAGLNIILDIMLVPTYGLWGIGIANIVAQCAMTIVSIMSMRRYLPGSIPWCSWIKTAIAGMLFFAVLHLLRDTFTNVILQVGVPLAVASMLYVATLFALRVLRFHELKRIVQNVFAKNNPSITS